MVFSSPAFLFVFLPAAFLLERLVPSVKGKNFFLTLASLLFYAVGEPLYVLLLLASVLLNYGAGRLLTVPRLPQKLVLGLAVALNLGLLSVFKYAGFAVDAMNRLLGLSLPLPGIALPIGISFFTFQGLSYVVDVYRDRSMVSRSLWIVTL